MMDKSKAHQEVLQWWRMGMLILKDDDGTILSRDWLDLSLLSLLAPPPTGPWLNGWLVKLWWPIYYMIR